MVFLPALKRHGEGENGAAEHLLRVPASPLRRVSYSACRGYRVTWTSISVPDSIFNSLLPCTANEPAPPAPPTINPIAAPLPPPAMPPMIAPTPAPIPLRLIV